MPIYEYECEQCGERFEKLVFGSSPTPECPACSGGDVKKVPSVFGFSSGGKTVTSTGGSGCDGCTASTCAGCK